MPLADDISYYMETAKKKFDLWWMYQPFQNKLVMQLGAGGLGALAALYIYFTYMGSIFALGTSVVLGILSIVVFFSGVKRALS